MIALYLATYFLVEITARIYEGALLLVLFAGLRLTEWHRILFLVLIVCLIIIQYGFRIDDPWLGFGF